MEDGATDVTSPIQGNKFPTGTPVRVPRWLVSAYRGSKAGTINSDVIITIDDVDYHRVNISGRGNVWIAEKDLTLDALHPRCPSCRCGIEQPAPQRKPFPIASVELDDDEPEDDEEED
jgi:hypothetical protein